MSELDLPLRRANYLVWRLPFLKRRVKLEGNELVVYSTRVPFTDESFLVKPSWTLRAVRGKGLAIREGDYMRLTLFFRSVDHCREMELTLEEILRQAHDV